MKLKDYIKDKLKDIFVSCTMILLLILMLMVFKVKISFIIAIIIVIVLSLLFIFFNNFIKRKIYYDNFINTLNNIDKKYLISEMITRPNFLEGKILYDSIYAIDKSMNDKINNYKYSIENLKDYIEMWIHEVKIPLSNLLLIYHNNKKDPKITKEISRIENYIDQVLYYFRSENAENDYLIKKYDLKKIINKAIIKNKELFIYNKITLKLEDLNYSVLTDSKWLEFIINQIINNSLKYTKENGTIKINAYEKDSNIILEIIDDGIGISKGDLFKVFEKTFTGNNGRNNGSSTGMGLYICQNLCDKLGHQIKVESEEGKYTKVSIIFNENDFYNVLN